MKKILFIEKVCEKVTLEISDFTEQELFLNVLL